MIGLSTHWQSPYWESVPWDWVARVVVLNPGPFSADVELRWAFTGTVEEDSFSLGQDDSAERIAPAGDPGESRHGTLQIVSSHAVAVWGATPLGSPNSMGWVNMTFATDPAFTIDVKPVG